MAISIAVKTPREDSKPFVPCTESESTVQKRIIVIKLSAGQKIQVSHLASVFPAPSGRIPVFVKRKPSAMQKKSVSIGVSVAKKVVMVYLNISLFSIILQSLLIIALKTHLVKALIGEKEKAHRKKAEEPH